MSFESTVQVRPVIRVLAGFFGVAFALAGLCVLAIVAFSAWQGVRTGHVAWKLSAGAVALTIGSYSCARLFLEVFLTGENLRIDQDEEAEALPPAI